MAKKRIPKVLFRYCNDMEHIVVFENGFTVSDGYEGYPKLTSREVLYCLAECGIIELDEEEIIDEQ